MGRQVKRTAGRRGLTARSGRMDGDGRRDPRRRRGALLDLEPAALPPPRSLGSGAPRAVAGIGSQLTLVAVGLNVFDLVRPTAGCRDGDLRGVADRRARAGADRARRPLRRHARRRLRPPHGRARVRAPCPGSAPLVLATLSWTARRDRRVALRAHGADRDGDDRAAGGGVGGDAAAAARPPAARRRRADRHHRRHLGDRRARASPACSSPPSASSGATRSTRSCSWSPSPPLFTLPRLPPEGPTERPGLAVPARRHRLPARVPRTSAPASSSTSSR